MIDGRTRNVKNIPLLLLVIGLSFVVGVPSLAAEKASRGSANIPFSVIRDSGIPYVHVLLNGKYEATFLLDTGAFQSSVSEEVVAKAGISAVPAFIGDQPVNMGKGNLDEAYFSTISMGTITMRDYPLLVVPELTMFRYPELKVDGILGIDVLSRFVVAFDFPQGMVSFFGGGKLSKDDLKDLQLDNAASVSMFPDPNDFEPPFAHWMVNVTAKNADRATQDTLTVDTGSPDTVISRGRADRLGLVPYDRQGAQTMQEKEDLGNRLHLSELDIGGISLKNWNIGSFGAKGTTIPPLLGEDIFGYGKVVFDFPAHKLYYLPTMSPALASAPILDSSAINKNDLQEACVTYIAGNADMSQPGSGSFDYSDPDGHIAVLKAKIAGTDLVADAKAYDEIGDVLYDDNRLDDAKAAYEQSVALNRQIVAARPADASAAADLSTALTTADDIDEALQVAQDAVSKHPDSSKAYRALGLAQHAKSLFILTGSPRKLYNRVNYRDLQNLVSKLQQNPPAQSIIDQAAALAKEAKNNFDTGVRLAPTDPNAYRDRASFVAEDAYGRVYVLEQALNSKAGGAPFEEPDSYDADMDTASELKPYDADRLQDAINADHNRIETEDRDVLDRNPGKLWDSIPRKHRKAIEDKIKILTDMSQSETDPHRSAEAFAALAGIGYIYQQSDSRSIELYKSALDKDPTDGHALASVSYLLSQDKMYAELLEILKDALAKKDCALTRSLIAQADNRMGYWQDAMDSLQAGLGLKPDSCTLNIQMAYQLLSLQTPEATSKAKQCILAAQAALGGSPHSGLEFELEIAWGIYQTLSGDVGGARERMVKVLDWRPLSTQARQIIAAGTFPEQDSN